MLDRVMLIQQLGCWRVSYRVACQASQGVGCLSAAGWEHAAELLDRAMLIYRLGAVAAFKGAHYQAHTQEANLAQVR